MNRKTFCTKLAVLMMVMAVETAKAQTTAPSTFSIQIANIVNDDDDMLKEFPHRSPVLQGDVSGTYDASSGTLSLCASFDIACVRIYKDDVLIMEDSYPVMDDGTVYYNLSFYGSGAYRICIFNEEDRSYYSTFTI